VRPRARKTCLLHRGHPLASIWPLLMCLAWRAKHTFLPVNFEHSSAGWFAKRGGKAGVQMKGQKGREEWTDTKYKGKPALPP